MTAINIIRQKAAVHVLTDGAGYSPDGTFTFRMQKVFPLAHLKAVIAVRGSPLFGPMFAHHASVRASGFEHLVSLTPAIAREEVDKVPGRFEREFDLIIAGWSQACGPASVALCSHSRHGFEPWQVIDLDVISLSPSSERITAELAVAYPKGVEPDDFDPIVDGLRVLEIQRQNPVEHAWESAGPVTQPAVGAFAQLTTVTADAITTRIIRRWPDEIGQPLGAETFGAA